MSGNQCAFPGCREPLVNNDVLIAEVCHIKGAKPGSPRHDSQQSDYERHEFNNLIILCANHHKVVDTDVKTYTVRELREMKYIHEARTSGKFSISDRLASRIAFALGGAAAGATLAELAHELSPLVGTIFNLDRNMTLNRLPRLLKAVGPGIVMYTCTNEKGRQLGEVIVNTFRSERWEVRQIDPQILYGWGASEPLLVVILAHANPLIVKKSVEAVAEFLRELEFSWQIRSERTGMESTRVAIAAFVSP